ncbi:MAG: hypothetical protein LBF62_09470 [Tannerellaceae bacterium]|jgi:hypothetical protein|nr:hypothetical protein [Tannerellaceae bacterium]
MAHNFISVLKWIAADEYGITAFKNRKRFITILQGYAGQNYTKEIQLLQRLSNFGYVSKIAKENNNSENIVNTLSRQLNEDECIDKDIAREVTEALILVIGEAKEHEKIRLEERRKQAKIEEHQEHIVTEQKKQNSLEIILSKLLKSYGVNALDNPDFCRAWLKDIAMGDYIDEITVLSMILNAKAHRKILKRQIFRQERENMVKQLEQEYRITHEYASMPIYIEHSNLVFNVLISVLEQMKNTDKQKDGGVFKWPMIFRRSLKK